MPQIKTTSWNYDSVKTHYAKYRDSVVVDYYYDTEDGFESVWVHKDADYQIAKTSDYDSLAHESQYYVVPAFIAIITTVVIFAFVLLRDNEQALREKRKDSILNMMNNES